MCILGREDEEEEEEEEEEEDYGHRCIFRRTRNEHELRLLVRNLMV